MAAVALVLVRDPEHGSWIPNVGDRVEAVAPPDSVGLAVIVLRDQDVAVRARGGTLSGVAARSLDASVQRYSLHLRALERHEAHDEEEPLVGDQSASSEGASAD